MGGVHFFELFSTSWKVRLAFACPYARTGKTERGRRQPSLKSTHLPFLHTFPSRFLKKTQNSSPGSSTSRSRLKSRLTSLDPDSSAEKSQNYDQGKEKFCIHSQPSPTLLYQLRQGWTTSGSSMPLSSTYQMLKLKLGPHDSNGTAGEERRQKWATRIQTRALSAPRSS